MNKKCIGCGSTLQTKNSKKEGYINSKVYDKAEYCERCFKITHYGEASVIDKKIDVINFLDNIQKDIPVLYLLDLTCLSMITLEPLKKIKNKIYLVLTKRDLLPKSIKDKKIINYIKEYVSIENIFVISNEKMWNIDELYNKLKSDKIKTIYCIGHTSSGKSSLINSLLKSRGQNAFITTSPLPNTTTELINIELEGNLTMIDTPGFINEKSISNFMKLSTYKSLLPKKEIKPKIYNIRPGYMIIINDFLRIENNSDKTANLIFYLKNELNYRKMKTTTRDDLKILEKINIETKIDEDIVIEGLGFIKVPNEANLTIYTLDKSILTKRKKLI